MFQTVNYQLLLSTRGRPEMLQVCIFVPLNFYGFVFAVHFLNNTDYKNKLQIKTFKKWVKKYCEVNKLNYHNDTNQVFNNQRYFYITKDGSKINKETDEMPF